MDANLPIRIQFTLYHTLVAEVIVPLRLADKTAAHYLMAKYDAGKEMGAVTSQRADLPRYFDVPVGSDTRRTD